MFQFYQHFLNIYTVFSQQKCNPRHLDKKSLPTRIYFWAGLKGAHPLHFLSITKNNNEVNRTWRQAELGCIQLQEPKHWTRALSPHCFPNIQLKLLNSCYHETEEKSKLEFLTRAQEKRLWEALVPQDKIRDFIQPVSSGGLTSCVSVHLLVLGFKHLIFPNELTAPKRI